MTRITLLITLAAAAALAGCNSKGQTIGGDEPKAENAPVALPPSITGSKAYRCKDNHVVYIDWMSDGTAASIHGGESSALPRVPDVTRPEGPDRGTNRRHPRPENPAEVPLSASPFATYDSGDPHRSGPSMPSPVEGDRGTTRLPPA